MRALLEPPELFLHRPQLLDLLGRRLALQLRPAAQVVDLRDEVEPDTVGGHQLVERVAGPLAIERGAPGIGVAPGGADVDHERESRDGFDDLRHALLVRRRADEVCEGAEALVSVCDRHAVAGPFEQLDVVLAVSNATVCSGEKPSRSARKSSPEPLVTPLAENSRKIGSDFEMCRRLPNRSFILGWRMSRLVRVGDADELRGRPVEPGGKIADLGDAQLLERRVALGSRRELTDVELVVDVDVEHVPLRLDGVDGLARQREGNGS